MSSWPGRSKLVPTTFGALSRSALMQRVHSSGNRTTEMAAVRLLRRHSLSGWRRHLGLPGKPDFAWHDARIALFVDGCFWHGHDCGRNLTPRANALLWQKKLDDNRRRDRRVSAQLRSLGWSVVRVWECALRKSPEASVRRIRRLLN